MLSYLMICSSSCMPQVMCSVFLCLQVFGASITDAILSHDMLIVMYASGYVKFYSFQFILQQVSNDQVFR